MFKSDELMHTHIYIYIRVSERKREGPVVFSVELRRKIRKVAASTASQRQISLVFLFSGAFLIDALMSSPVHIV